MTKGTYIIVLKNQQQQTFNVGKLGSITTQPGYYVYIGSAMGPGGIAARLAHHARISRRPHWHIDYLRAGTSFHQAWALESEERKECEWAGVFAASDDAKQPMQGFGSSDCSCTTHLYFLESYQAFTTMLAGLQDEKPALIRV